GPAREAWLSDLRDAACPPLNANRVMGNLGSIVASRIARALRLGGPSFTLSAEENSGMAAAQPAVRLLQGGVIDTALVGAVDLPGDIRSALAHAQDRSTPDGLALAEGAVAFVLRRKSLAQSSSNHCYALINDAMLSAQTLPPVEALQQCGY